MPHSLRTALSLLGCRLAFASDSSEKDSKKRPLESDEFAVVPQTKRQRTELEILESVQLSDEQSNNPFDMDLISLFAAYVDASRWPMLMQVDTVFYAGLRQSIKNRFQIPVGLDLMPLQYPIINTVGMDTNILRKCIDRGGFHGCVIPKHYNPIFLNVPPKERDYQAEMPIIKAEISGIIDNLDPNQVQFCSKPGCQSSWILRVNQLDDSLSQFDAMDVRSGKVIPVGSFHKAWIIDDGRIVALNGKMVTFHTLVHNQGIFVQTDQFTLKMNQPNPDLFHIRFDFGSPMLVKIGQNKSVMTVIDLMAKHQHRSVFIPEHHMLRYKSFKFSDDGSFLVFFEDSPKISQSTHPVWFVNTRTAQLKQISLPTPNGAKRLGFEFSFRSDGHFAVVVYEHNPSLLIDLFSQEITILHNSVGMNDVLWLGHEWFVLRNRVNGKATLRSVNPKSPIHELTDSDQTFQVGEEVDVTSLLSRVSLIDGPFMVHIGQLIHFSN